jgi:hypothetical protein
MYLEFPNYIKKLKKLFPNIKFRLYIETSIILPFYINNTL